MRADGSLDDDKRACFKLTDLGRSHLKTANKTGAEATDLNNLAIHAYSELATS